MFVGVFLNFLQPQVNIFPAASLSQASSHLLRNLLFIFEYAFCYDLFSHSAAISSVSFRQYLKWEAQYHFYVCARQAVSLCLKPLS